MRGGPRRRWTQEAMRVYSLQIKPRRLTGWVTEWREPCVTVGWVSDWTVLVSHVWRCVGRLNGVVRCGVHGWMGDRVP